MSSYTIDWYRVPIPPERLAQLNRRSDLLGLAQSLGHLGLLAATGAAAWWGAETGRWAWFALALFAHGTVAAFMINAVHELVHGTVFRSGWLNALFVHVFAFLGWINHRAFWASHAEHHRYTLHDPHDREVVVPIRYAWAGFVSQAILDPFAIARILRGTLGTARGELHGDWQRELLAGKPRHRAVRSWAWQLLLGHGLVLAVSAWQGWWLLPILVSLTPCYAKGIFWLLNNTQHVGLQDHVRDFRLNCRTIEVNPLFRFLYWHMNYHIEHHMYAAVPCYRLRALHREIRDHLPPTPRGLVATWYQIIGILWRQQREPGWQYAPPLPEDAPAAEERVVAAPAPQPAPAATAVPTGRVWECRVCGFIYREAEGLPAEGIAPGTAWDAIPDDWRCPDCGVAKADFDMVEIGPAAAAAPASTEPEPVVIVGSGLAGYGLAREIRRLDPSRAITLVTRDGGEGYHKPDLSNALAAGRGAEDLVQHSAAALAAELELELRTGVEVQAIDRERRVLRTEDGEIAYGQLVLALGADQIELPLDGDAADAVLRVNDLDDYRRLRARLGAGDRVLLLGAGLIGCEFADDLAAAGHAVTAADLADQPLPRLLPPELGQTLHAELAARGVSWRLGTGLERLERSGDELVAHFGDGGELRVDHVLSAVGLRPRTALAAAVGLAVDAGIAVDAQLRTSDPAIFALGDCAAVDGVVRPFVAPLRDGARAPARTLCGEATAVDDRRYPVMVKTPSCPVVALPPAGAAGSWQVDGPNRARFVDDAGVLRGFALLGPARADLGLLSAAIDRETAVMAG